MAKGPDHLKEIAKPFDPSGAADPDQALLTWLFWRGLVGIEGIGFLSSFGEAMVTAGLPVARGSIGIETVHPEFSSQNFVWRRDGGVITQAEFHHDGGRQPDFLASPMFHMMSNELTEMRCLLEDPAEVARFGVFETFRTDGMTDWYGALFPFEAADEYKGAGQLGMVTTWTTDQAGGFTEGDLARLRLLLPAFALVIKSRVTWSIAEQVAATYLGPDAGGRVLAGEIRRGSVQTLDAVIFFADLRDFTAIADRAPRDELVAMLDDYLDAIAEPVESRGGQVLKFMGDGLLATFDLTQGDDRDGPATICATALAAAHGALTAVARLNDKRAARGQPTMALDVALHQGEVLYGNVGSARRLDFTVVGPAVNEASRIEAECGALDVNLLVSESFYRVATASQQSLVSLGRHRLRGVREPQELFGLAAETP